MRKQEWNTSVAIPMNQAIEQDHQRKQLNIRIGLESHPIMKQKDKQIEPGCDTREDYQGWNVSTLHNPTQMKYDGYDLDERAHNHTETWRKKYLSILAIF